MSFVLLTKSKFFYVGTKVTGTFQMRQRFTVTEGLVSGPIRPLFPLRFPDPFPLFLSHFVTSC